MSTNKMKVEVWTDIMCPYCYIGKLHYEKALRQFDHANEIELSWKAFQLNPNLPDKGNGYPVKDYLLNTAGYPEESVNRMFEGIARMAAASGVNYNLPNAIAANSRDAHRLIKMAAKKGADTAVLSSLGKAYFEDAKDYSDIELLVEIGKDAGLQEDEIRAMLASDDYAQEVDSDIQEAANLGIDTVPTFLIDRRQAIIGSESVEVFLETLNKAYDEWKSRTDKESQFHVTKGKSCNADGICEI